MIDQVTASDIISVANKYFNNIIIQSEVKQFDKKLQSFKIVLKLAKPNIGDEKMFIPPVLAYKNNTPAAQFQGKTSSITEIADLRVFHHHIYEFKRVYAI